MYILANMWFTTLMRQFFFNIDKIVFNFISSIYDLLITIARTSVLTQADIADMADRIYDLLTVFMIFKVVLSLITYVVNPDDFTDKSKGVAKLGTNIIISLALLILTPYIFNYAYQLQTIVLEDNSLATLIFGDQSDDDFFTTAGDDMAFLTLSPFFTPDVSLEELFECTELTKENSSGDLVFNSECSGVDENFQKTGNDKSLYALTSDDRFSEQTLKTYIVGVEQGSLSLMFREDMAIATDKNNENYIMDYKYLFSTVIGVVVILLLISFCMDVGVRSIKLAFLQLIAPIPILSYVDPKSGKDGMFKKWYEMCFKTFISLFVRLLAIYFAVYIISKVADLKLVDVITGAYITNPFVVIFIIIGALIFAKQFPKILEGLGLKLDGGFTLNPLKKLENEALAGKQISGFTRGAVGAAGAMGASAVMGTIGAYGNVKSRWAETDKKDRFGLVMGGLTSGLSRGLKAGGKGFMGAVRGEKMGKNFTNSYSHANKTEKARMDRLSDGVSWAEMTGTKIQSGLGMRTVGQRADKASELYKKSNDAYKAARENIIAADDEAKSLNEQLKILEAASIDRRDFTDKNGVVDEVGYMTAVRKLQAQKDKVNKDIDARVADIMTGDSSVFTGTDQAGKPILNETSTRYVQQLNEDAVAYAEKANDVSRTVDSGFGGAKPDIKKPKQTAKSSQTASSAISATEGAVHGKMVDKYAGTKNDK